MPLYEYRCTKCGNYIEILQKFSDPPRRRCGECAGKLEKLISRTSFQLKGGGWYAQGYGGSSGGKGSGGGANSSGAGGSSTGKSGSDKAGSEKGGSEKGGSEKGGSGTEASAATA